MTAMTAVIGGKMSGVVQVWNVKSGDIDKIGHSLDNFGWHMCQDDTDYRIERLNNMKPLHVSRWKAKMEVSK